MRFKPAAGIRILMVLGIIALVLAVLAVNLPLVVQWFIQYRYGALLASQGMQFHVSHVGKTGYWFRI